MRRSISDRRGVERVKILAPFPFCSMIVCKCLCMRTDVMAVRKAQTYKVLTCLRLGSFDVWPHSIILLNIIIECALLPREVNKAVNKDIFLKRVL